MASGVDRRTFLRQLLMATAAVQTVDIERLLWVPKSMVTVPGLPIKIWADTLQFDRELTHIALTWMEREKARGYIMDHVFPIYKDAKLESLWAIDK